MKKIICMMLILVMACGLCACTTVTEPHEETERIGYVIVPHADGDEHADIYNWSTNNGIVYAYCLDGRFIASPQIIVVLEP
jgi:hypothetical protein